MLKYDNNVTNDKEAPERAYQILWFIVHKFSQYLLPAFCWEIKKFLVERSQFQNWFWTICIPQQYQKDWSESNKLFVNLLNNIQLFLFNFKINKSRQSLLKFDQKALQYF